MNELSKEALTIAVPIVDSHLENTKDLLGDKLAAMDGEIGHVRDFYFDDKIWVIRYAIADTGSWLTGRLVLLSPYAFGRLDQQDKTLHINLRKMQIQDSPSIESHKPVSRQYEVDYYTYYGWPAYWDGGAMWGLGGYPTILPHSKEEVEATQKYHHRDDKHLQSAREVVGYNIATVDGHIGHVTGFLVDDRSWAIRELVVETGHWYSGKEIRIPTNRVERISYEASKVVVNLTKADIQKTADHALAKGEKVRIKTMS
ncbi:MAG TPA: PRC-barrel domain-containing protein [Polyangia bacterium]